MFAHRPDVSTPGRYVFCPPNTPTYPGFHNLWSKDWVSDELDPEPELGEDLYATRQYANGRWRATYPPARLVGDANAVSSGSPVYPSPVPITLEGGWDSRCYLAPAPIPPAELPVEIDIRECDFQNKLMVILLNSYGDGTAAETLIQDEWPTAVTTSYPNNTSSIIPGCVIAVIGSITLVIIPGTTNPQQWALQALTSSVGVTNYGVYGTLPVWETAARRIATRITNAGGDPDGQIVLVGHSYGAAVACLLAARFRSYRPNRYIRLLTAGCPKPGDDRLIAILNTVQQRHLVNIDDPVTFLPPSRSDLGLLEWLIPPGTSLAWSNWIRPRNVIGLRRDGTRVDNPQAESIFSLLLRILREWINGNGIEALTAHTIDEYARRTVCPPAPAPPPLGDPVLWLQTESLAIWKTLDNVTRWPDTSIYRNDAVSDLSGQPIAVTAPDTPYDFVAVRNNLGLGVQPLLLGTEYTVISCIRINTSLGQPTSAQLVNQGPGNASILALTPTGIGYFASGGFHTLPLPVNQWLGGVFSCRRTANQVDYRRNRVLIGSLSILSSQLNIISRVTPWVTYTLPLLFTDCFEVIIFDDALSDAEWVEWMDRICDKFGVP